MPCVSVKWRGKTHCELDVDLDSTTLALKQRIQQSTNVSPANQKLFYKGKLLKDEDNLGAVGITDGVSLMLMGTPDGAIMASNAASDNTDSVNVGSTESGANVLAAHVETERVSPDAPMGLLNMGNTCYMNASLQALYSIVSLRQEMESQPTSYKTPLPSAVSQLFRTMTSDIAASRTMPLATLAALHTRFLQFAQRSEDGLFQQQDAEECLSAMLSEISASNKVVANLFSGTMAVTMTNTDTAEVKESVEHFTKLSCHISQSTIDVLDGLLASMSENLTVQSDGAKTSAIMVKSSKIVEFPEILYVNFVRFFWKPKDQVKAKILKKVKFPLDLDLRSLAADKSANCTYELLAVITHIGRSADSGHYIAWVCTHAADKSSWWKCDDDKVSPVSADDIKKLDGGGDWHTAYVCMYRKKSAK